MPVKCLNIIINHENRTWNGLAIIRSNLLVRNTTVSPRRLDPNLCGNLLYNMVQDFLDRQYILIAEPVTCFTCFSPL